MRALSPPVPGRATRQLRWVVRALGWNTVFAALLLAGAWLRETIAFWRSIGGYPVLMRVVVKYVLPLGFGLEVVLVGAACLVLLRQSGREARLKKLGWLLVALQGLLLAAVVVVVIANNLSNFINGRPWHWKPE